MAKIAFFDGNALVHRAYHAVKPLTTSQGELTNAVFGFATMLLKTFGDHHPDCGAVAFDKRAPTFRHEAYAEYKANRTRMAEDLAPQFERVRELVQAFGMPIFEQAGFEADDLLGTLARQALERGLEVLIVTGDTDALQLVRPGVKVLTPSRGMSESVLYDVAAVRERYGLEPVQIIDYKALKGDPSDNIKGVPGIGEKTAQKLLQRYGTIERLLELPDDLEPKYRQTIEASADALRLGKRLTRILDDVPVELEVDQCRLVEYDRNRALVLLRELEFRSLIDRLPPTREVAAVAAPPAGMRQGTLFEESVGAAAAAPSADGQPSGPGPVPALGEYRIVTDQAGLDELVGELERSGGFAFDTETADLGSLVQPLIGLSFSTRPATGWYVPVAHRNTEGPQLELETVAARLRPVLADPAVPKFGHHAKYDLQVLRRHGMEVAGLAFDSMIAAFVLDTSVRAFGLKDLAWSMLGVEMTPIQSLIGKGKQQISLADVPLDLVANYACADADVTLRLRERLEPKLREQGLWELFATVELPAVPVLAAMEEAGVAIDVAYLLTMSDQMAAQLGAVEQEIYEAVGHQFNVNSPIQLGKVLFDELQLPRGRRTRTGWSTDADTLEELRGVHPVIDKLFDYRQVAKLKSTYVDALPTMVSPRDGRVHTSYNQIGASTGRLSSSEPNLQNIPIRSELGRAVRRGFVAGGPGLVLLGADYSQVELRILAHITRDEALMAAFDASQDIHRATASQIFAVEPGAVSADQRRLAKVVNYGIAYGLGEYGLSVQAGISRQEAGQFIRSYLERYPGIARYIEETKRSAEKKGYVETLMGRRISIPEIASVNRSIRAAAERRAINAPIQGSNADFMKLAMARVADALAEHRLATRLILQVHDELVFEAPRDEVEAVGKLATEIMGSAYPLNPPLEVEIKVGTNWCDVE
jgi:DNA polymerase-1